MGQGMGTKKGVQKLSTHFFTYLKQLFIVVFFNHRQGRVLFPYNQTHAVAGKILFKKTTKSIARKAATYEVGFHDARFLFAALVGDPKSIVHFSMLICVCDSG
jgi:hypothetical protein